MPHRSSAEHPPNTTVYDSAPIKWSPKDYVDGMFTHFEKLGIPMEAHHVDPKVIEELGLSDLPHGVVIIGGAARAIFQKSVLDERAVVRDIDLALVSDLLDDGVDVDALSERYMPDDNRYGHGAEYIDPDEYFLDRDFTINEVLVIGEHILITQRGAEDLKNKVIRPSLFDYPLGATMEDDDKYTGDFDGEDGANDYEELGLSAKLQIKGLLMKAVFIDQYGVGSVDGYVIEPYDDIPSFFIALGLNKAFQYGEAVTDNFIRELIAVGLVGKMYLNRPIELAEDLLESVYNFEYRGSDMADKLYRTYEAWAEIWDDMPEPFGSSESHAIGLWECYAGKVPGASVDEYV